MEHTHDFVRISDLSRARPGVPSMQGIPGAEVGCVECGEIRRVWSDGKVETTHEGNHGAKIA